MTPQLRATLEAQRAATDALQRKAGSIVPYVFHRRGAPIKGFVKAWRTACVKAGLGVMEERPGKNGCTVAVARAHRILHAFRRTSVRNLKRAGVPRSSAMKMVGHRTESVYRRSAIVDEVMLREAREKLARAEARS